MARRFVIPDIIINRRTVRKFNPRNISTGILETLVDAARHAPCPNNLQPWRFIIRRKNDETTVKIIKYLEKEAKENNIGISIFLNDAIKILSNAPTVIYVFNSKILTKKFKMLGRSFQKKANLFEHQAISAAIENLLLCAEKFGLGAVWLGSPVFLSSGIEDIFDTKFELCAVIGIGYYDKKPKRTNRLPLDKILTLS